MSKMSRRLKSGHEVVDMDEEWLKTTGKRQGGYKHGMVRLMPEGWLYPGTAPFFLDKLQTFEFRSDDVLVVTFPKSGTTWMQEILWTMVHNPNLDNPKASQPILLRSIDISSDMMFDAKVWDDFKPNYFEEMFITECPGKNIEDGMRIQYLQTTSGRRVMKSHYPFQLMRKDLLEKTKVIYLARNVKDVVVSFYYFMRVFRIFHYKGSYEDFTEDFLNNELVYTPYWQHLKGGWDRRHHPNLHFVFYEEMKADIMGNLKKLNEFIQTNLSEIQLENVAKHTAFSSMKSRGEPVTGNLFDNELQKKNGGFFRKGTTGDWKNHFTPELLQKVDQWIERNAAETGVCFK